MLLYNNFWFVVVGVAFIIFDFCDFYYIIVVVFYFHFLTGVSEKVFS